MHRFIVAFLAAFDAVIAVTVGLAVVLAMLTVLWIFGASGGADWGTLWPVAVAVWQLGNLVPLHIRLPAEYLAVTGIGEDQASFLLSLAPLAFAAFTMVFAARSGARASGADAWITGVLVGSVVFAGLTTAVAVSARTPVAAVHLWQAVLFPALLFAVPATIGAVVTEWRDAGAGVVARIRDRIEASGGGWGDVPGLTARGGAAALVGLVGAGALVVFAAVVARGSDVVALFQASGVDLVSVIVFALGQLAYLPTLIVWGAAFVAGPGFQIGTATTVAPAGTQLGVVPGIPVLGLVPESTSMWLLLLALVPVGLGAFAGWIARSRLAALGPLAGAVEPPAGGAPLAGLIVRDAAAAPAEPSHDPVAPRLAIAVGIAVVAAGGSALLAWFASGSLGPGRLAEVGPEPGPVAFAVGVEVLIGASILLLSPRRSAGDTPPDRLPWTDVEERVSEADAVPRAAPVVREGFEEDADGSGIRPSVALLAPAAPTEADDEPRERAKRPRKKKRVPARAQGDAETPPSSDAAPDAGPVRDAEPDAVTAPIELPDPPER